MPPNVPEEKKTEFNKTLQKGLLSLSNQVSESAFEVASLEDQLPLEAMGISDPNGNIVTNPLDLFSTPIDKNKSKILNLVDADGNTTERGKLLFNLHKAGMFDDSGVITQKGKDYLISQEDIVKPENLEAFKRQWDDGVIRDESAPGDILDAVVDFGGQFLSGAAESTWLGLKGIGYNYFSQGAYYGLVENRPEKLQAEQLAANVGFADQAVTGLLELGRLADVGYSAVENAIVNDVSKLPTVPSDPRFAVIGRPAPTAQATPTEQDIKIDDSRLYAARQRQFKTRLDIENLKKGEIIETVLGAENVVKEVDAAKAVIGESEFNRLYEGGKAYSQIATDPTNLIPIGVATKVARAAPLATRASLKAQNVIGEVLTQEARIADLQTAIETANLAIQKGAVATKLTTRFADEAAKVGATPAAIARAEKAAEIAGRTTKVTEEAASAIPELTAELEKTIATRNSLATRIPEAAANATIKTMEAGRSLRAMPAKAIGGVLEGVGQTLTKVDTTVTNFLKDRGLDQMYTAAVGAAGVAGIAGSPVIGAVATGAAALKTGKMLSSYGKLFKYVGKEMTKTRGQIPFWKRVAAHTEPGSLNRGIAHTFNMLDLGGVTSDTLRRAGRGVAAAYPVDLMFEYVSNGADMRPQTLYQAAAESLVFGGSVAAAGGAFMGTKSRMKDLSNGDVINFNQNMTDPQQKVFYNQLSPGMQRSIATYAIANPTLNYVFKDSGSSNYDPNTNTATINVNSNNSIKPLVAHETLHHTVIKNNMEGGISALFLGDTVNNTAGGLLRSKDGKLDPNFEAFKDAYYQRLGLAGMTDAEKGAIYPLDKIAVEYFIEQHSDKYASMAESGELGAIAASGDIKRKLSGVLETVLPRIPVLRDLHFKSGGMIDKDGAWVTGNGILSSDGVKTNPITQKMFRDMNRRSSGLAPGQFEPLMSDKQDGGAQIVLDPSNPIDSELLHPLIKVDENGNPILENGKPVALDKATILERALSGLTAKEVMARKKAENYIPEKGEAHVDDAGEFQPGWLSNDVLAEIFSKNRLNPEQKRIIREFNRLVRKGAGDRVVMINFPATTRNKSGKVVYKPQAATMRDTVPVSITISKDGNLLFGLMSVTKLQENIQKRSQSKRGKKLYGGNVDLILRDTQAMMQFHKEGVDSIEYFKEKYGAVEATERKNFINTMFGMLNQREQAVLNPMLIEDGVKSRDNVYRTYRADRVSKAVAMSPDEHPSMPFSYEAVSQVKMPEQTRQMPENVSPEDLNPVANRIEAQRLFADGKRMFAVNEMDDFATEITSLDMLNSYPPDTIGYIDSADQSSARYMPEKIDAEYMPEPLNPKTYENQKGYDTTEILKSKLDNEGKIVLTKPTAPNGALTLLRDRRTVTKEIPIEARDKFLYDELAKVTLYKNEGKDVSFNYDPETQIKPVIKDAAVELAGKKVQIAMADRAMAALGDLGGILFPNLKVNQITFTGPDGIKYKPVWANMGWKPVLAMKVKAIQQGSVNLLTYIMGKDAHASNLRSVRTVSNEIANAGLQKHHEDLFITLANYGKMLENNATQAKTIQKHSNLISKLNEDITLENKVETKKEILKKKDLIKKSKEKITKIPKEFESLSSVIRAYRSASTRFENGTGSLANKNSKLADLEAYLKTPNFKKLAAEFSGKQLIEVSNSFNGRKAALDATTGFEIEGFSTNKVIDQIGEFKEATNNQVLGAVELSSNPDLFAIYLGNDPKQIKFMSETEKAAAKYFKEHPDFVRHEAYDWVQLGPENGNNFLNSKPKKLIDYFKDFGDNYKKATGKYPKTENAKVGAMRDGMSVVLQMPKI